jgi:hypothetical protein|tara:strand:- start:5331 stop:6440 length:1110 start_codon:yes stop_codon:yes gene_type:complete
MFKDISPDDRSIKEFKTYKKFTFTNSDSGSGVYGLEGISGSFHNFNTGSAASQSFGLYNAESKSLGLGYRHWYQHGTFFKIPVFNMIKHSYYRYDSVPNPKSTTSRFPLYSGGNWSRKYPYGRESWGEVTPRELHDQVNVITIPQEYYGEEVKPYSFKLTDDSSDVTLDIRDDGHGQLYDYNYSSSFAAGTLTTSPADSGSCIGNIFYEHGIVAITNTGSQYIDVGTGTGGNGWEMEFNSTKTSYEYSYLCNISEYQFNSTTNPSTVVDRYGSVNVTQEARFIYNDDMTNPSYENTMNLVMPPGSSSYQQTFSTGTEYKNFTTHSLFGTYVTNIGLYNDTNELMAIAKISNPIKNDKDLPISFLVRFDS